MPLDEFGDWFDEDHVETDDPYSNEPDAIPSLEDIDSFRREFIGPGDDVNQVFREQDLDRAMQDAGRNLATGRCLIPQPSGYRCTRDYGHGGPCAATPVLGLQMTARWQPVTWYIDPGNSSGNADNRNDGLTRQTPFHSYAEVQRRLSETQNDVNRNVTIHVMSGSTEPMEEIQAQRSNIPLSVAGMPMGESTPVPRRAIPPPRDRSGDRTAWSHLLDD